MRLLHTSDWHLGKSINNYSRIPEQILALEEICAVADGRGVDLVIVAGDIYDTYNPPSEAEQLFYKTVRKLSADGRRPVIIIAGNHDSESRLAAPHPLANELGIFIAGAPGAVIPAGDYGGFSVAQSGSGFLELSIRGENAVLLTIPYPSEKRLNEIIFDGADEKEMRKSYSQKIGEMLTELSSHFRADTINCMAGHFYIAGGETSKSEREVTLGGAFAVSADCLPDAQYIAMGHLHRPQKIRARCPHAYYSGSLLQYSKSEANYAKCVFIADIKPGEAAAVEKVPLSNRKPVEIWRFSSVEDAVEKAEKHANDESWVFIEITTDKVIQRSELQALHKAKKDIVEIVLISPEERAAELQEAEERTLSEEFIDFYMSRNNSPPSDEMVELFLSLCGEGWADDETDNA